MSGKKTWKYFIFLPLLALGVITIPLFTSCYQKDNDEQDSSIPDNPPTIYYSTKLFAYFQDKIIDNDNLSENSFIDYINKNNDDILLNIKKILNSNDITSVSYDENLKIKLSNNSKININNIDNVIYDKINNTIEITNFNYWNNIDLNLLNLFHDLNNYIIDKNQQTISEFNSYIKETDNLNYLKEIILKSLGVSNLLTIDDILQINLDNNELEIMLKNPSRTKYLFDSDKVPSNVSLKDNIILVSNLSFWKSINFNNLEDLYNRINNQVIDKNQQTIEDFELYLKSNLSDFKTIIFNSLSNQNNLLNIDDLSNILFSNNKLYVNLANDKIKYSAVDTSNVIFNNNQIVVSNLKFWTVKQLSNLENIFTNISNDIIKQNKQTELDFENYIKNNDNLDNLKSIIVSSLNNSIDNSDIINIELSNNNLLIELKSDEKIKYILTNDNDLSNVSFSENIITISNLPFWTNEDLGNISNLFDLVDEFIFDKEIMNSNDFNQYKSELKSIIYKSLNSMNSDNDKPNINKSNIEESNIDNIELSADNTSILISLKLETDLKYSGINFNKNISFENNVIKISNLSLYDEDPENWYIWNNNQIIGISPNAIDKNRLIIPSRATSITNDALVNIRRNLKMVSFSFSNITRIDDSEYVDNPMVDLPEVDAPNAYNSRINDHYKSGLFSKFTLLKQVKLPKNLSYLGKGTFFGCAYLDNINLEDTTIDILNDDVFLGCSRLSSIQIPSTVTSISNKTFYGCRSLTQIELPDSLASIGKEAFSWCELLEEISIPNSVEVIEESTFFECISLKNIKLPNSLKTIKSSAFQGCILLSSIEFPDSLTSIEEFAFSGCKVLSTIKWSNSIETIGNNAFWGCQLVEEINFPNSLTFIGDSAFSDLINLKTLTLSNNLESIGKLCFKGCRLLSQIVIPNSLTNIGAESFYGCTRLTIIVPNEEIKQLIIDNNTGFDSKKVIIKSKYI